MIEFDEISIRNEFIKLIREIFAGEYDLLGTEVQVEAFEPQEASFPICLVSLLNPISVQRYDDSDGSFGYVDFSLNCELFSNELNELPLEDSIVKLSQILIKGVLEKYPSFIITRNNSVPFRTDVLRRVVTFHCVYDNANKIIYSN